MTGEEYLDQARHFLRRLTNSLTHVSIVTHALPLTSAASTLNDDQVPRNCNINNLNLNVQTNTMAVKV